MKNIFPSLLLLLLNFFSCNSQTKQNNAIKLEEKLSIVDYNLIIENKTHDDIEIETLEIGNVNLPTGKIIICDPLMYIDSKPLVKTVTPGKYPIKIYVAKTKDSGDRHALAQLEFSKKKAIKWVLALRENENIKELEYDDSFFGFPVDAGLASFFDYKTGIEYQKFESDFAKSNPNGNIYDDFFEIEFKKNSKNKNNPDEIGDWINYTFPNTELNIPMFQSGYGDGFYPAYWGIDEQGNVSSLVIDFFVINLPEIKK